jgi:hypothetical protein
MSKTFIQQIKSRVYGCEYSRVKIEEKEFNKSPLYPVGYMYI